MILDEEMAMDVQSNDQNSCIYVKGDLRDLQIIEEEEGFEEKSVELKKESTFPNGSSLAKIPDELIQGNSAAPVFGAVQLTDSDNAHLGNNTYFNGPVTIKHVVQNISGVDNATYQRSGDEDILTKSNDNNNQCLSKKKFEIKSWHKWSLSAVGGIFLVIVCALAVVLQKENNQENHSASENQESSVSDSKSQEKVKRCSEDTYLIIVVIVGIQLLWIFYSLLTHRDRGSYSYCDGKCKEAVSKQPLQHCTNGKVAADDLLIAPDHLRIVTRTDWLAQPVSEKIDAIKQPVPWVIITHTATNPCYTQSSCVLAVRIMQTFHIESRHWSDIAYNFLVGGDGSAYFGRGWDQVGAHTLGYNRYSIAIAFIGTFNTDSPTQHQVNACKKLIKLGVAKNKIAKDYKLLAHRQLMSTLSPGDMVFNIIKTWPHFYNDTDVDAIVPKY